MKQISIIIATYNRAEQLLVTLDSVAQQTLAPEAWECVVVDNNSQDDTQLRVKEYIAAHTYINIKLVFEPKQGLSHARNCGINSSSGEIIAIIDDDEVINREFAASYVELFTNHKDCESAGGPIIPRYVAGRPRWMSHYTELPIANPLYLGSRAKLFPRSRIPGGGNMAIRRSTIERYGAFDTELGRKADKLIGGEESDLFERLQRGGAQCWWCPGAIMWHIIPPEKTTDDYFDRLTYNIGVSQKLRANIQGRKISHLEVIKWGATLLIAFFYTITLHWRKACYLVRMRRNITRGITSTK